VSEKIKSEVRGKDRHKFSNNLHIVFDSQIQRFDHEMAAMTVDDQQEWTWQILRVGKENLLKPLEKQRLLHPPAR
jgi:hypothetical protein